MLRTPQQTKKQIWTYAVEPAESVRGLQTDEILKTPSFYLAHRYNKTKIRTLFDTIRFHTKQPSRSYKNCWSSKRTDIKRDMSWCHLMSRSVNSTKHRCRPFVLWLLCSDHLEFFAASWRGTLYHAVVFEQTFPPFAFSQSSSVHVGL